MRRPLILVVCSLVAACDAPPDAPGPRDGGSRDAELGSDGGSIEPADAGPELPAAGDVEIRLHPGPGVVGRRVVTFGVPFPPGELRDPSALHVTDADGVERAVSLEVLARWPDTEDVRAVRVQVELDPSEVDTLTVRYGGAGPSQTLDPSPPGDGDVPIEDGVDPDAYPGEGLREPAVYATLPAAWLSRCAFRSVTTPIEPGSRWSWFDEATLGFASTAVNDVDPRVTDDNLIAYTTAYEPWLFDRTMTLYLAYVRTGDVVWLRRAHRSARFYRAHLDDAGNFDLKDRDDLKYSYGQSLLTDYLLFGDAANVDAIERVATAGESWNETYTIGRGFWTERHQTYALLAALSAWEATGSARHRERVDAIFEATLELQRNPPGGWPRAGCFQHTGAAAAEGGEDPVCSPWMSALLADAIGHYHVLTRDPRALELLAELAEFVARHAVYTSDAFGDGARGLPSYLASSTWRSEDPWSDAEHACDVSGLLARGLNARATLGGDTAEIAAALDSLLVTCEWALDYWHRPTGPDSGRAVWRLAPPRKVNWWFGTTSDLPYLLP